MIGGISRCASRTRRLHLVGDAVLAATVARSSSSAALAAPKPAPTMCHRSSVESSAAVRRIDPTSLKRPRISSVPSIAASASTRRFSTTKATTRRSDADKSKAESPREQTQSFLLTLGYSDAVSEGVIDALLQNGIPSSSLFGMVKILAGRYEVGEDGGLEALAASVQNELEKEDGKKKVKVWCLPSTGWSPAPDGIENSVDSSSDEGQQIMPVVQSMDRAFAVEAVEGTTLTDVAKFGTSENCDVLGEYLECACAGIMACSTCHVVVHPDWYDAAWPTADDDVDDDDGVDDGKSNDATKGSSDEHPTKIGPPSEAEQDMIDLAYEPQPTSRLGCQIKLTKELDGLVVLLPKGSNNLMDFVPFE